MDKWYNNKCWKWLNKNDHFITCGGHPKKIPSWVLQVNTSKHQHSLKIKFELKPHIFLLGIIPESIHGKCHNLSRYLLTAARASATLGKKGTLPMIQDLETKSGEKAEMAKLTLYIQNRNVTEFRQEQLFYTLHVTQRCRVRPLKYDF